MSNIDDIVLQDQADGNCRWCKWNKSNRQDMFKCEVPIMELRNLICIAKINMVEKSWEEVEIDESDWWKED